MPTSNGIGTLNEGPLHQALKALYLTGAGEEEVPLGGYVADVQSEDDVIYEIQTGGFAPLKRDLAALLEEHQVVLDPMDSIARLAALSARPTLNLARFHRVFSIDIETCRKCGGKVRVIACIEHLDTPNQDRLFLNIA